MNMTFFTGSEFHLHWPISSGLSHCFQAERCIKYWWWEARGFTSCFFLNCMKLNTGGWNGNDWEFRSWVVTCWRLFLTKQWSAQAFRLQRRARGQVITRDSEISLSSLSLHTMSLWPQVTWHPLTLNFLCF